MAEMLDLGENQALSDPTQSDVSGEKSVSNTTPEPPVAGEEETGQAHREAWQQLVNGPYKDLYTQDTQRIINERFKRYKTLEKQLADTQPVLEQVMSHFGLEGSDLAALSQAVTQRQQEAQQAEALRAQRVEEQVERWLAEAGQVLEVYPDFDLDALLAQEEFLDLISHPGRPVSLRRAYEVTHLEDILARQADRVVDSIRARGTRPEENGTTGQSGFTVRQDVDRLTPDALAEIRKRVMSGERISFG